VIHNACYVLSTSTALRFFAPPSRMLWGSFFVGRDFPSA
jgi:hypothetical protein